MIAFLALLLCAVTGSQQVSITEFAVPSAIELGESAELQCRYSADAKSPTVKWWWTPNNETIESRVQLYQWITGHEPQTIPHANLTLQLKDNNSIILQNLQPIHSGTYECEVSELAGDEDRKHQDLTVYTKGSGPEVNISTATVETEAGPVKNVYITCEALDAAPYPELVISVDGKAIDIEENLESSADGTFDVYANATLAADTVSDGTPVACELFYKDGNISHPAYIDTELLDIGEATTEVPAEASAEPEVIATDVTHTPDSGALVSASCALLAASVLLSRLV